MTNADLPVRPMGQGTRAVHAGQETPDPATGARAVPIYASTSFVFRSPEHAAGLFGLQEPGDIYTRISNPTTQVFEERMAALEDGVGAVAMSSGQAAEALTILNLAQAGDSVVASRSLYGGTFALFQHTLARLGVTTRFVLNDPEAVEEAIDETTRAVYVETIGNPGLDVADLEGMADVAHRSGLPLVVDNTFATPIHCRPIHFGADVVIHSATKWIGGHGRSIAGVVVEAGQFDWGGSPRFAPLFGQPEPAYNGLCFSEAFGDQAFLTRLRAVFLRDLGPALSPFDAFLLLQGLESLHVRVRQHSENALRLARFLESHPGVAWVAYPGLPGHPTHSLGRRYLTGELAARDLLRRLRLFSFLANVGDAKSLIIHPWTTTHAQLAPEDREAAGVTADLLRVSVGIEDVEDLEADLDRALRAGAK